MAEKKKLSLGDLMKNMTLEIESSIKKSNEIINVPSIVDFCEKKEFLGLDGEGKFKLFPLQMLMLKIFYRGSVGNENLELSEEEIKLIKDKNLHLPENGSFLEKWENGEIFKELVLAWGRRSGKDFTVSIIAAYEAAKLLLVPNGDPYKYYNTSAASPITILTVANSQDQAGLAFYEIHDKIRDSPFFEGKIGDVLEDEIWLTTPKDIEDNIKRIENKMPTKKGSILIKIGHSNAAGLLGKGIFVAIFDEVATYKQSGSNNASRMYSSVTPAVKTYVRYNYLLDSNGNKIYEVNKNGDKAKDRDGKFKYKMDKSKPIYDGKIISISSPRGKDGKFWELYFSANEVKHRLMMRCPTWVINPLHTEESLRREFPDMTESEFQMEIGAEFSGTAGEAFFPRDKVIDCFQYQVNQKEGGEPGKLYYAHLDPATTSDNYALAIVHKENNYNQEKREIDFYIVVDHIKYWHPLPGKPISIGEVDNYILSLKDKFHMAMVSYDLWNSEASIEKLSRKGIPAKCTHYSFKHKMVIYSLLYDLVISGRLRIPAHQLLMNEMLNLQRKYVDGGFMVRKKMDGDCKTDDIIDAVCGAVHSCISSQINSLPKGILTEGAIGGAFSEQRMWNSMSGPIGYGTGQQVSSAREKIASFPSIKII